MAKPNLLKPGMLVPKSGQYEVVGPKGGNLGGHEATLVKGERVPPSRISSQARLKLVDKTNHKTK